MKKAAVFLLALCLLIVACACSQDNSSDPVPTDYPADIPQSLLGCWYPHPEAADGYVELRSDNTCSYYGEERACTVVGQEEGALLIEAGDELLTFYGYAVGFSVLQESIGGICLPNATLWSFAGEWIDKENGGQFYLDFLELTEMGCAIEFGSDYMQVTVMENDTPSFVVVFSMAGNDPVAEITRPDGSTVQYLPAGNWGDSCSHDYVLTQSTPVTCTQDGSQTHTCTICGNTKFSVLTAPGHDYQNRVCTRCGAQKAAASLVYTLNEDGKSYAVTGIGDWDEPVLVIPAEYSGLPVTAIGDDAFKNCTFLTGVTIPDSIRYINYRAFYGCAGLKTVQIPNSVTFIGGQVFIDCTGLESVKLPDSLTNMGGSVFFGCTSLKECVIPKGLEILPGSTFGECTSLTRVVLPEGIQTIDEYAFAGCTALTDIRLPESIGALNAMAFHRCHALKQLNIPANLQLLEKWALAQCTSLSVTIPGSVLRIGPGALASCKSIYVSGGMTEYRVSGNCLIDKNGTLNSAGLDFTIPTDGSVTAVGDFAFLGNLCTQVVLPDSIRSIGEAIFSGCTNLKQVTLPKDLTAIPDYMFMGTGLESYVIPNTITSIGYGAFQSCENLKSITIPQGVTQIGAASFAGCTQLDHVVIPRGVTTLLSGVFQGCTALTDVTIPDTVTEISSIFNGCTSLKSVVLPDSVVRIYGTFYDCTALQSVTLPKNLAYIGDNTFRNCHSLATFTMPDTVTELGTAVFMGSKGLKEVTLSTKLTKLPSLTFSWCTALETVSLPGSVTLIESNNFVMCNKLRTVYFGGTQDQYSKITVQEYNDSLAQAQVIFQ